LSDQTAIRNAGPKPSQPIVSALQEKDLPEAARIVRVAFGTYFGAPDPDTFWNDRDYVYGRQPAAHVASFGAKLDGKLVGSNFVTNWGSVAFFGPLTVHPDLQERGVARALLARTIEQFDSWGTAHAGLFTFSHSAKHVALYQKYGFYARFLTAVMSAKAVQKTAPGWSRFSELSQAQREEALQLCRGVTETIYPGLDLSGEIAATHAQGLGDTVLLGGAGGIAAFGVCHYGPRSEAGAGHCFIKFGAVRDGPSAEQDYLRLLDACEVWR
jgi:GNAT superfamily N-acetyltransferase